MSLNMEDVIDDFLQPYLKDPSIETMEVILALRNLADSLENDKDDEPIESATYPHLTKDPGMGIISDYTSYDPYFVVQAEGHRIAIMTCNRCGALVLIPDVVEEGVMMPDQIHDQWHKFLSEELGTGLEGLTLTVRPGESLMKSVLRAKGFTDEQLAGM